MENSRAMANEVAVKPAAVHIHALARPGSADGVPSVTHQSGEFDTMPPSQYSSPSIVTGGKPGGSDPLARMWSGPILRCRLSKYTESPVRTFTAPTDSRTAW